MPKRRSKGRRQAPTGGDTSDEDGVLYVGGVRLKMNTQGNLSNFTTKHRRSTDTKKNPRGGRANQRRTPNRQPGHSHPSNSKDSSSGDDEDGNRARIDSDEIADYLKNTGATSSEEDDPENPKDREKAARQELEMLRRFVGVDIGEDVPIVDLDWDIEGSSGFEQSSSSDDDDGSSWTTNDDENEQAIDSDEEEEDEDMTSDLEFGPESESAPGSMLIDSALEPPQRATNDGGGGAVAVAVGSPGQVSKALASLEAHLMSEEYRQAILATAEGEARLDAAAVDPEVYLMKSRKRVGGKKKKQLKNSMEGVDAVTLTVIYERRAQEKRDAARANMDRYNSLLAQASSLKLGPRPDDITDQVSKLQALLDKHTGRVAQWPVLLAKQPARQERGPKKGSKSGVKGAKCGKLAPGEKAQLRKQKINDKRAARASAKGFDLAWCNKELQDFVEMQQDLKAFPPMGKPECRALQKLAAMYGCKATAQGSGKRRIVMVASTPHSALPTGASLLQVGMMLADQAARELRGVAAELPQGKALGRWSDVNTTRRDRKDRESAGKSMKHRVRFNQPVAFVSSGVIDPNDEEIEVVVPGGEVSPKAARHFTDSEDEDLVQVHHLDTSKESLDRDIELLPVFEDRSGSEGGGIEGIDDPVLSEVPHRFGIGLGASPTAFESEGLTNTSRMLRLGMALGMGPELLNPSGGLGAFAGGSNQGADLSPLQRKLSRAEQKRHSRKAARATTTTHRLNRAIEVEEEDMYVGRSGLGLGASPGLGLGSGSRNSRGGKTGQYKNTKTASPAFNQGNYDHGNDDDNHDGMDSRQFSGSYASFERHTTGIGSKLLSKWGFQGEGAGLGREGEGRAEPIFVKKRSKGLGLGA